MTKKEETKKNEEGEEKERRRIMKIPGVGGLLVGPTNICSAKKLER